ncbi:MAG: hypothetical protein TREMPRED_003501 [Tremellales sp. Tagirdzhanova-0007]|nr:MAG: hypothetical protein TREMPRED_003501 [Tremellales sp. Tagirdzhanova-0007]
MSIPEMPGIENSLAQMINESHTSELFSEGLIEEYEELLPKHLTTPSRLGKYSFLEPKFHIPSIKVAYPLLGERQKNLTLTAVFLNGISARSSLCNDLDYTAAKEEFFSEMSKDQQDKVRANQKLQKDQEDLQLFLDLTTSFDHSHFFKSVIPDSQPVYFNIPLGIHRQLSREACYMVMAILNESCPLMTKSKVELAAPTVSQFSAKNRTFATERFGAMTIQESAENSLSNFNKIRLKTWSGFCDSVSSADSKVKCGS